MHPVTDQLDARAGAGGIAAGIPQQDPVKSPVPELIVARDMLAESISLLEDRVDELATQLTAVLRDPLPVSDTPGPPISTETQLGAHLGESIARVVQVADRVRDLRDRVAL